MVGLHESPKNILGTFVNVRTAGIFRKVLTQRHLKKQDIVEYKLVIDWGFYCTSWILALNPWISLKNSMIDVRLNQRELMTDSKRTSDSPSSV